MSAHASTADLTDASNVGPSGEPATKALTLGIIGVLIGAAGLFVPASVHDVADAGRPWLGYLTAFGYWMSFAIGMTMLTMIGYIFDAGWSVVLRRRFEHGMAALPVLGIILGIPVLLDCFVFKGKIWQWINPEATFPGSHDTIQTEAAYQVKKIILSPVGLIGSTVVVFTVFLLIANRLRHHSFAQDKDGSTSHTTACRKWSAFGIPACALSLSLGAIMWFKSLDFHWFSTMYGVWYFAASIWGTLAVTTVIMHNANRPGGYLQGVLKPTHFYFVASIMLAFTVFWSYISFSQYFLIYGANLTEENFWYNIREKEGWFAISMVLIFGHFFAPFLLLLGYARKFGNWIYGIAFFVLFIHGFDLYWNILPGKLAAGEHGVVIRPFLGVHLIFDLGWFVGFGGLCAWAYFRSSSRQKVIPIRDPRIEESLHAAH